MGAPGGRAQGLVVCSVGPHRLAVRAGEVTLIEADARQRAVAAGRAYGLSAPGTRFLATSTGRCLGVDHVEVVGDPLPLLPVPAILRGLTGGSLQAFIVVQEKLIPVLGLDAFLAHLELADE